MSIRADGKVWIWISSVIAIVFGLLTIREGGSVLFGDVAAGQGAGQYVPFVVWFNFLAGFGYVVAGIGLWFRYRWAARLAFAIAASTLAVFAALGIHIAIGGGYELRTITAMSLRSAVWLAIALAALRLVWGSHRKSVP